MSKLNSFPVISVYYAHTGFTSNVRPVSLRFASAPTPRAATMYWKQVNCLCNCELSSLLLGQVPPETLKLWSGQRSSWRGRRLLTGRSWRTTPWSCWKRELLQGNSMKTKHHMYLYYERSKKTGCKNDSLPLASWRWMWQRAWMSSESWTERRLRCVVHFINHKYLTFLCVD